MLVVVSDIHLLDGSLGVPVAPKSFSLFASRLQEMAYQASMRADGTYRPIEQVDILLLGDIFDPLQSKGWLQDANNPKGAIRPWHDPQNQAFIVTLKEITRGIIRYNAVALSIFRELHSGRLLKLPPGTRQGQPAKYTLERVYPKVQIHYMVGNHDWFYCIPGPEYDLIRAEIIQAMGLSNPISPFPHKPEDSPDLAELFNQYNVVARHGDIYDGFSYNPSQGRSAASLGDIYSTEFLYRFPYEIQRQTNEILPPRLVANIQNLMNIRPALAAPVWLRNQIHRHGTSPDHTRIIKRIWNEVAAEFLSLDVLREQNLVNKGALHSLRLLVSLSKAASIHTLADISHWLHKYMWSGERSIARFARQEASSRQNSPRAILYGHTHAHEVVPMPRHNQVYINTGTWATFYEMNLKKPVADHKTISQSQMTCVAIYRDGERRGRPYEAWWANFT